jgi:hypothetical protein
MRRPCWLLVLLFLVSLPAVTRRLYASDEIEYFSYLRSIWFDRDLSFDNEYRYFYDRGIARGPGFKETFLDLTTPTGLRYNFGTIGSALLWSPMYLVADVGVRIARARGSAIPADGLSGPYISAVAYGSAIYGFFAILLSASVARRVLAERSRGTIPDWAAAIVWFGTPLPFYMYLAPGMAHACSAFAVAAFVAVWLRVRRRWSAPGLMALGALAALMTMVREQDALFAIGVAVDFLWTLADDVRAGRRETAVGRLTALPAGVVAVAVCFLPQAWAYLVLNGHLGPATYVADKMRWYSPHALQVAFSPEHGLFFWTPLALVCVVGLFVGSFAVPAADPASATAAAMSDARISSDDRRRIMICLLLMFVGQIYISGSVDTWTVAGSFGQRRFLGASVAFVTGLAILLQRAHGWRRTAAGIVIVLCVWWNLGTMAQFGANMMDRQRLQLADNAYNTFVKVPIELPNLAYRYLFDRASFYRPPQR